MGVLHFLNSPCYRGLANCETFRGASKATLSGNSIEGQQLIEIHGTVR